MSAPKIKKVLKLDGTAEYSLEEVKDDKQKPKLPLVLATEVGFTIVVPMTLGALFGLWLDNKYQTHPKLTLSFLFLGIFLAFGNLFILVKRFSTKKK